MTQNLFILFPRALVHNIFLIHFFLFA